MKEPPKTDASGFADLLGIAKARAAAGMPPESESAGEEDVLKGSRKLMSVPQGAVQPFADEAPLRCHDLSVWVRESSDVVLFRWEHGWHRRANLIINRWQKGSDGVLRGGLAIFVGQGTRGTYPDRDVISGTAYQYEILLQGKRRWYHTILASSEDFEDIGLERLVRARIVSAIRVPRTPEEEFVHRGTTGKAALALQRDALHIKNEIQDLSHDDGGRRAQHMRQLAYNRWKAQFDREDKFEGERERLAWLRSKRQFFEAQHEEARKHKDVEAETEATAALAALDSIGERAAHEA